MLSGFSSCSISQETPSCEFLDLTVSPLRLTRPAKTLLSRNGVQFGSTWMSCVPTADQTPPSAPGASAGHGVVSGSVASAGPAASVPPSALRSQVTLSSARPSLRPRWPAEGVAVLFHVGTQLKELRGALRELGPPSMVQRARRFRC